MLRTTALAPARRRGMADEVADRIREAIFSGVYAPGAALREVELGAALHVSRGPVREALLQLEREGLVRSEWHRGTTITTLSAPDIAELHSLRGALETLAVGLLVQHADGADLAALHAVVDAMERAHDTHTTVRLDVEFHDAVFAAAHHRRLTEAWQTIRSQVHLYLLLRVGPGENAEYTGHVVTEHRELAEALSARDAEHAQQLFAEHRRHAFDVLTGEPPS